jgi:hypothetical protein
MLIVGKIQKELIKSEIINTNDALKITTPFLKTTKYQSVTINDKNKLIINP